MEASAPAPDKETEVEVEDGGELAGGDNGEMTVSLLNRKVGPHLLYRSS